MLLLSLAISGCAGPALIHVSSNPEPTSAPGAPTLMIRLDVGNDDRGVGLHTADYLSDGTVIRWAPRPACEAGRPCGALESNSLTTAGLAAVRALLVEDADLLAESTNLKAQMRPGESRSGRSDVINTFVLERPDGTRYTASGPSATSFNAAGWAPDPAIERLNALAEALVDPATVVGANGLVDSTWQTYQPAKTAVFISLANVNSDYPEGLSPDISSIGWPFEGTPDSFGTAFKGHGFQRCAFLPSADAMAGIAALSHVGEGLAVNQITAGAVWGSSTMLWAAKSPTAAVSIRAVALLPGDAAVSCADALAY